MRQITGDHFLFGRLPEHRAERLRHPTPEAQREHGFRGEQRAEAHAHLLATGWKEGNRRQHPHLSDQGRCVDCGDDCEPTESPLDRLCRRCRDKRR